MDIYSYNKVVHKSIQMKNEKCLITINGRSI